MQKLFINFSYYYEVFQMEAKSQTQRMMVFRTSWESGYQLAQ